MKTTTFLLLIVFGITSGSVCAKGKKQDKPVQREYNAENCIVPFTDTLAKPTNSGYAHWYLTQDFSKSGLNVKLSYVDKTTATHPPHRHPHDECFFILEGEAIVTIGDKQTRVKPMTNIYCPGDVPHGIRRAGEAPIKYLVINVN